MIQHFVLFKFKDSLVEAETKARLAELQSIDGVLKHTFGRTFTDRHQGFTHILYMELKSKEVIRPNP